LEQTIPIGHAVAQIWQLRTERLKPGRRAPMAQLPQGSHRERQAGGDRKRCIGPVLDGGDKFVRNRLHPCPELPRVIQDGSFMYLGMYLGMYLALSCPVVGRAGLNHDKTPLQALSSPIQRPAPGSVPPKWRIEAPVSPDP
jgi:hypothetical protein